MDSTSQTAPRDIEIINELLSGVTHRIDSTNSHYGLIQHQRTAVTGHAWIRQPKQPLGLRNHQRTAVTGDPWIRQPKQPLGLRNHQRTAVTGDPWIRQPKQLLRTQKSSTNCCHGLRRDLKAQTAPRHSYITNELLSLVTHGWDNPNSP
jgi:hypothetical protein